VKLALVGVSTQPVCGIRDYATTLKPHLEAAGAEVRMVWHDAVPGEPGEASIASLKRQLSQSERSEVILWNYSPFTYGHRGVPTRVPSLLALLRRSGQPLVPVLHELAHNVGDRGTRGLVHGVTQRAALVPILRASKGVVVTTAGRADWLATRRWLPQRPRAFVPVPSNIPVVNGNSHPTSRTGNLVSRIGVFGFRADGVLVDLVAQAVPRSSSNARLVLVGAPGPDTAQADLWRAAAAANGCDLEFTGVLDPSSLSAALADLDLAVFPNSGGPTSRNTTLAALLEHGRPIVAVDGPHRWDALAQERALVLVDQDVSDLASALRQLADSSALRREQGERAREFYRRHQAPAVVAAQLVSFVSEVAL
jgi:glycosyltransferase involved in cell wall biosynthesis